MSKNKHRTHEDEMDDRQISRYLQSEIERNTHEFLGSESGRYSSGRQGRLFPEIDYKGPSHFHPYSHFGKNDYKSHKPYESAAKWRSCGGIVMAGSDRSMMRTVYMVKPSGTAFKPEWTWPKGRQDTGESKEQTAVREVAEEAGIKARICIDGWLGEGSGAASITDYYLMLAYDVSSVKDTEMSEVRPVCIDEAISYLEEVRSYRDLTIAKVARERINALYEIG